MHTIIYANFGFILCNCSFTEVQINAKYIGSEILLLEFSKLTLTSEILITPSL